VVNGEKAYRFSPKYPNLEINSPKNLLRDTQVEFLALDLQNQDLDIIHEGSESNLSRISISEAEKHGIVNHLASVYDPENDRIRPGLDTYGPRILDFADILKYDYAPLAKTIEFILDIGKEALGSPVEIEYAVDLNKSENGYPSFYLLQIKPLLGSSVEYSINMDKLKREDIIIYAEKSMGNGRIDDLLDVIYVRSDHFDHMKTKDIVGEIEILNKKLLSMGRNYILIGPGRWGTADPFIGIPVNWSQISGAKVIVETSLADFPLDASLGSHFFHNVTSMNVGYMSIQHNSQSEFVDLNYLETQELIEETHYLNHIRFKESVCVVMDGKKRISVIYRNSCEKPKV